MNNSSNSNTSKRTILIIEDSQINQDILYELLSDEYNIIQAENGKIGLEVLKENYKSISLILLDVIMPVMDGYEFLDIVKGDSLLSSIPIIVTTSNVNNEEEIKCLDLGATDFVSKPYKPRVIRKRINSLITLRESSKTLSAIEFDDVTGIYTKQAFYHYASEEIWKNPKTEYTILTADIMSFKVLNESFGEKQANSVLKYVANELSSLFPSSIASRYNGDCFALIFATEELIDESELNTKIIDIGDNSPLSKINLKVGIYNDIDRLSTISVNCDRSFLALKKIKSDYNTHISFYDNTMREELLKEKLILDGIDDAINQEQFKVFYQAKHDAKTGKVIGAEALIRWIHPELGFMSPGLFIPICENSGAISRLDYFVWTKACQNIDEWKKKKLPVVPISVNASRGDLLNSRYIEKLLEPIHKYNIEPKLLHVEITESMYTDKTEEIINVVKNIREIGIEIELDDFGSGYSSLGMLNKLPIDVIKMDMSFAQNLVDLEPIVEVIIQLSKRYGYKTVAEGIETRDQADRFTELGCDYFQGFYYSKPLPKIEFEEYLQKYA